MARRGGVVGVYARPTDDLRRFREPVPVAIAAPGDENLSDSSSALARFDSFFSAGDLVAGEVARDLAGDLAAGVFLAAGAGDFFAGDLAARGDFFAGAAAGVVAAGAGAGAGAAAGSAAGFLLVRK